MSRSPHEGKHSRQAAKLARDQRQHQAPLRPLNTHLHGPHSPLFVTLVQERLAEASAAPEVDLQAGGGGGGDRVRLTSGACSL